MRIREIFVMLISIFIVGAATVMMLGRVTVNYKEYTFGYKLNELRRNYEDVESDNNKLKLIYSTLTDSHRIIETARLKLHMYQGHPSEIQKIKFEVNKK